MNRKVIFSVMPVFLLSLGLVLGGCDNGSTGPDLRSSLVGTWEKSAFATAFTESNGEYNFTVHENSVLFINGTVGSYDGTTLDIGGVIVIATLEGSSPTRTLTMSGFQDAVVNGVSVQYSGLNGTWTEQ
jgi:hypothetical protein